MAATFRQRIETLEELRTFIPEPEPIMDQIQLTALDEHCRAFIARSPFIFLGTASASGECDVSPKGDGPGFVHVPDEHTLLIPDRKGNRRADSLCNILDNPHAAVLFMIPGVDWTLRVNGRATIVRNDEVRAKMAVKGSAPDVAIAVQVEEAFMHCPRCMLRAGLWDTAGWMSPEEQPSFAAILRDHAKLDVPVEVIDAEMQDYNKDLY